MDGLLSVVGLGVDGKGLDWLGHDSTGAIRSTSEAPAVMSLLERTRGALGSAPVDRCRRCFLGVVRVAAWHLTLRWWSQKRSKMEGRLCGDRNGHARFGN